MGFSARTTRFATRPATPELPCPPLEETWCLNSPQVNLFTEG